MPSPPLNSRILLRLTVGLTLTAAALGTHAAEALTDPAETRIRQVIDQKIAFAQYAFDGREFPRCDFENPGRAHELLGDYHLHVAWYDPDYRPVLRPDRSGPYGAIVEVATTGRPLRRFCTLYHLPRAARPSLSRFGGMPPDLVADNAGLPNGVGDRQAAVIRAVVVGRGDSAIQSDPRFARLLAGLWEGRRDRSPLRKWNDAYAMERQWWVGLKRTLTGAARRYPHGLPGPDATRGKLATEVHEGTPAEAGVKPDAAERIDRACRAWAADTDEAFAICVVRHGVIVIHRAYGYRDGAPMTVDTKSWMASVTKTMSASLMLQAIDRGVVGIDDRVDRYVPALRGIQVPRPLTIRHLYTHTSGLGRWPGWNDEMPDVEERIADYYPWLGVGKEWVYTGTGNMLGSKILEQISGEALPILFRHHLLEPMGMLHTDVIGSHADTYSTPLDMAEFGQMLLNQGAYGRWRFFRPATFRMMLPQKLTMLLGPDATKTFGFGLDGTPEKFGHGTASAATFSIDAGKDLVVIMTRNHIGKNYDRYNGPFWQAIYDGIDPAAGTSAAAH